MPRCDDGTQSRGPRRRALLALLAAPWAVGAPARVARAQPGPSSGHRRFPAHALRGTLRIEQSPWVRLNGAVDRLAPGARLRGPDNRLHTHATLSGQSLDVHWVRESTTGLLLEVWVLSEVERANTPWPATPAQAAAWHFDAGNQRWRMP